MVAPLEFVAIHLGASNGYPRDGSCMEKLAGNICKQVMSNQAMRHTDSYMKARDGVVELVKALEDHNRLNCGLGSNLNFRGEVECDASLMCNDDMIWTGVGAVQGCKNPIVLAKSLYDQSKISRPLNLVQPNLLVAGGAKEWMRQYCPSICLADSKLITAKALDSYQKYKSMYDSELRCRAFNSKETVLSGETPMDTVGAIAIDHRGNIATALSSGGIILKHKGRLGQAAVPGAGCWAVDDVAANSTGVGEYLTFSMLAREVCETLQKSHAETRNQTQFANHCDSTTQSLTKCFERLVEAPYLAHVPRHEKYVGFMSVHRTAGHGDVPRHIYLSYGHNTNSLCLGYMSSDDEEAHFIESRFDRGDEIAQVNTIKI